MKARTAFRLGGFLAIGAIATAALVDLRPWRPPQANLRTAIHAEGPIRAGAGKAPVELPQEIPLAGYRPFGRAATGEAGPTYARTLLLEAGGVRTGIVLLELLTLPDSLAERIQRRLSAEGIECALLAATHTHTGPGGYDRAFLPQAVAVGRFDHRVESALVEAVHASLVAARSELAAARVFAGEGRAPLARNRDRKGAPVDDRLTRIEFRREDETPIATILRATAHPTIADRKAFSGDWPAVVMREFERIGGIGFVLQGAVGDATVRGARQVQAFGQRVLGAASEFPMERIDDPPALGCRLVEFSLPPPELSAISPRPLARLVSNAAVPFASKTSKLVGLRLGRLSLLGVPGEPTHAIGRRLEAAGGWVRTVGLAMDYAGYLVEASDMDDRVFSAKNAYFGAEVAERVVDAAGMIVERALADEPETGSVEAPLGRQEP